MLALALRGGLAAGRWALAEHWWGVWCGDWWAVAGGWAATQVLSRA